jgi:peptidoglycan/LPS O-acetylase OafA/YrhL
LATQDLERGVRLTALDGLRGWAALSVIIFHMHWEIFGIKFPVFRNPVSSLLGNGSLAVAIFFTLSGYVLTIGRWRSPDNGNLLLTLVRRYLRLEIPIMGAVLIAYFLMEFHLIYSVPAGPIVDRGDWLGQFADFEPNFLDALNFATLRAFGYSPVNNYGPFLWTMAVELLGSIVVLTISQRARSGRWPYAALLLFGALFVPVLPIAACLPAGALIALLQRDGILFRNEPSEQQGRAATIVGLLAWAMAAYLQFVFSNALPVSITGIVIFLCVMRSPRLQAFFDLPLSRWLGHISFPLYLIQIAVIGSLTSWLIVWLASQDQLTAWSAWAVALAGTAACLLAGWAYSPVERFTLQVIKPIGRRSRRVQPA